jgi:hypothetical protein
MVVMNSKDYSRKMNELPNEQTYVFQKDPKNNIERKTATLIRKSQISQDIAKIIPSASVSPRIYGLLKTHKDNILLIPIVNCTGSATYFLAKHRAGLMGPLVRCTEHHIKNFK